MLLVYIGSHSQHRKICLRRGR